MAALQAVLFNKQSCMRHCIVIIYLPSMCNTVSLFYAFLNPNPNQLKNTNKSPKNCNSFLLLYPKRYYVDYFERGRYKVTI